MLSCVEGNLCVFAPLRETSSLVDEVWRDLSKLRILRRVQSGQSAVSRLRPDGFVAGAQSCKAVAGLPWLRPDDYSSRWRRGCHGPPLRYYRGCRSRSGFRDVHNVAL